MPQKLKMIIKKYYEQLHNKLDNLGGKKRYIPRNIQPIKTESRKRYKVQEFSKPLAQLVNKSKDVISSDCY